MVHRWHRYKQFREQQKRRLELFDRAFSEAAVSLVEMNESVRQRQEEEVMSNEISQSFDADISCDDMGDDYSGGSYAMGSLEDDQCLYKEPDDDMVEDSTDFLDGSPLPSDDEVEAAPVLSPPAGSGDREFPLGMGIPDLEQPSSNGMFG